MERVGGIEPPCAAWKAAVLPLNYTRKVGRAGRRPRAGRGESRGIWGGLPPTATESSAVDRAAARAGLPAGVEPWRARRGRLVGEAGFEPAKAEPSDLQSDPFGRSGIPPPGIPESGGAAPMNGPRRRQGAGHAIGPIVPSVVRAPAGCGVTRLSVSLHQARVIRAGEFPSGQRGQTVNLMAQPSQVRILLPPPASLCDPSWVSAPGRS